MRAEFKQFEHLLRLLNPNLSEYSRGFMDDLQKINEMYASLPTKIDNQKIANKRIEIDILKAEEQILMILRDVNQDKRRLDWANQRGDKITEETKEALQYTITRAYLDIERYEVDVRHHKRRLALGQEALKDLLLSRVTDDRCL